MNTHTRARHSLLPLLPPLLAVSVVLQLAQLAAAQAVVQAQNQRDSLKASVSNYPLHGRFTLNQLVQFEVRDGLMNVSVIADLPDQLAPRRVEVEGSNATWVVRKRTTGAAATTYVTLTRYDFDAPLDEPWITTATYRENYLALSSQIGDNQNLRRIRLTQSGGTLSFSVSNIQRGAQVNSFSASATSLKQLHAEHPEEVRKHLAPLLLALTGRSILRPGAADVYRVYDQLRPDPAVAKKLDDVLLKLESDAYAVRQQASNELAALGAPGVLAVLRRDNTDLSPEARNRLALFIAGRSNLMIDDPAKARADGTFLIDCLDDDDPAVRAAARVDLEKLLRHPIEFDTALSGDPRGVAVDALRKSLDKEIRPRPATTSPAK